MSSNDSMEALILPKELRISVGTACNLHCIGCSKEGEKDLAGKPLEIDDYAALIEEIKEMGVTDALSLTGGEPLIPSLREKTFKLISAAKPLKIRLCTNGHFIDAKVAKDLRHLGVDSVQIGIDSSSPHFQNMRSGSSVAWQRTVKGLEAAVRAGLSVSARFTLYTANREDVSSTYRMISEKGCTQFKLRILFPSGSAISNCPSLIPSGIELAQAQYEAIVASYENTTRLELSQPCFYAIPERYNAFIEDNSGCGEQSNASISSSGNAEYCLFCDDGQRFGNVTIMPFKSIWNSNELNEVRLQRKRNGKIVGCPAFESQYNKFIGNYRDAFETPLMNKTRELEKHLYR
jgi:MoaA/NifB/PqqE/SkfB family radical SAM enzyme